MFGKSNGEQFTKKVSMVVKGALTKPSMWQRILLPAIHLFKVYLFLLLWFGSQEGSGMLSQTVAGSENTDYEQSYGLVDDGADTLIGLKLNGSVIRM